MRSEIFRGNYLFHLHTNFTDGEITIPQYFEFALKTGIEKLVFLEHIRRFPSYSVASLASQIKSFSDEYGISSFLGFETKLLPGGDLDISEEHFEAAEVIGIAEHGFSPDKKLLRDALQHAINKCRALTWHKDIVWVHPGLTLKNADLLRAEREWYLDLLQYAEQKGIRIERNLRYNLVPQDIASKITADSLVIGADAHHHEDLEVWKIFMNGLEGQKVRKSYQL